MPIIDKPWAPTPHPYFYNIPEGTQPLEMLRYCIKVPFGLGLALGWAYHISRNPDFHNARTTGKMLYTAFPCVGLGFLYCGGTFIAGHLRKKEDELNHVIGVLTTTPLVRKFLSFRSTFVAVTYAAVIVAWLKHDAMEYRGKRGELPKKEIGSGIDWYIWSQNKPADAGYLTYSLFK